CTERASARFRHLRRQWCASKVDLRCADRAGLSGASATSRTSHHVSKVVIWLAKQRFGGEKCADAPGPELATVSRSLESAKRSQWVLFSTVYLYLSGSDSPGDPGGALVVAPDGSGEPIAGLVGQGDRLVDVIVGLDREYRPEHLVLRDPHLRGHVREDGRREIVTALQVGGRRVAPQQQA